VETGGQSTLHIAQDALDQCEMGLTGIVHEEAHLLDRSSGRVSVRYCRAPARLRYCDVSATGAPSVAESLARVSTGVAVG
jgi:hypothetical protein